MTRPYNNAISNKLINTICYGRLTLESGVPVSSTDQTAKTILYFTPYNGNVIGLYDGSQWDLFTFSELSLSLSGLAANTNFDIFIYNNNGTLTLESTAWTNDTTRATALTLVDGIYVRSGAPTRRYLGTIRTTGTIGQCEDSSTRKLVWNYYNRVNRLTTVAVSTTTHTYASTTIRAWNNNTTLGQTRVDMVVGLADTLIVNLTAQGRNNAQQGVGIDTTTAFGTVNAFITTAPNDIRTTGTAYVSVTAGYHFCNIVQNSSTGTANFTLAELRVTLNN